MTCIIGIDPGLSGAIALLGPEGQLERLADLPVIRDGRLAWIDGGTLQSLLIDAQRGLLFPDADLGLAKHEGRAEALLLAKFGRDRMGNAGASS